MRLIATDFPGLYVIEPKVFQDERGFFMESYNRAVFQAYGLNIDFQQDNHARSERRGVLRGLHFQIPPFSQTKLVRATRGSVHDVVADLRVGSPTYGKHFSVVLSAENFKMLLVPQGFAHGYQCLEDGTEIQYKVDSLYAPSHDRGLAWNDPDLGIVWPVANPVLSEKDSALPGLKDFESPFRL